MTSGCEKRHFIGKSVLCGGLGLFAGETVHRGEMVLEYKGQIMLSEEHWLHAEWVPDVFYSFRLSEKSDNWTLDSLHFGNNARYINHASSRELENIIARSVYTLGALHLGLYATKDIYFGEEFAFNYDGDNTLCEKFEWIKPSARERG
jgi:SET domain-containing protein